MTTTMKQFLTEKTTFQIPKEGDIVSGNVIYLGKNEVFIDIPGFRTGVVRGPELKAASNAYENLKVGDAIEATVMDLENERGEVELSFRYIGERRVWEQLEAMRKLDEIITVRITEANKGGLIAKVNNVSAFMPVSQLSAENYPRVGRGEQSRILEKLRVFINKQLPVKIITVDPVEKKLIISERAAAEAAQRQALVKYKIGDQVVGEVSKLTDYGAFMKFDSVEGFAHISELSWGRVDSPSSIVKVGDKIKTEIIGIDGARVMLSIKKLTPDPWQNIGEKFKVGDTVKGKVVSLNPFGLYVEVDPQIQGLAHISELGEGVKEPLEVAKIGDELDFKIIALEPENHRLSLSIKALKETQKSE
jgi:ribosomal protein S1